MRSASPAAVGALAAVAGAWGGLILPGPASAGSYRVALCNPKLGVFRADAAFARSSRRYRGTAACGAQGKGLVVSHDRGLSRARTWGAWLVRAPTGTAFIRLGVSAAGRARAGNVQELAVGGAASSLNPFARPGRRLARVRWAGVPASAFAARLACRRSGGCAGPGARIRIKRFAGRLDDSKRPVLHLSGSLLAAGSRRGLQAVTASASDLGGGIRRLLLSVNGVPVSARTVPCRLRGAIAIRLRPCPGAATASFAAATASAPFRQGPNLVRVCAADFALTTAANRSCAERRVRIDNLCPLSARPGGAVLRARLRRRGGAPVVRGRVRDASGRGLAGARVCVAARVGRPGTVERVVATPLTGPTGRFRARLARGPSRDVRVAYWPDPSTVLERHLALRVPARPRLRLRPPHPIANGKRVRFQVRLPGPAAARRRVRIQARAGRHWIELRTGRTGAHGIYRARYRFHATTVRRRYAFRAVVPRQSGYPYAAGRSPIRRLTVTP